MAQLSAEDLAPYADLIIVTETADGATIEPADDSEQAQAVMKEITLLVYRKMAAEAAYGHGDDLGG